MPGNFTESLILADFNFWNQTVPFICQGFYILNSDSLTVESHLVHGSFVSESCYGKFLLSGASEDSEDEARSFQDYENCLARDFHSNALHWISNINYHQRPKISYKLSTENMDYSPLR